MMSTRGFFFAFAIATINAYCLGAKSAENTYGAAPGNLKDHLDRLVRSYPDQIAGHDTEILVLKNGRKFRISDGRTNKTFRELVESPDVDDMFYSTYPLGTQPKQPEANADPGRVRFEPLFVAMYGDCNRNEVVRYLRAVDWLPKHGGGKAMVTRLNGVAGALEKVSRELDELPDDVVKYLVPAAGTYNCRRVAGSRARSMHAYGAAIDINTRFADYWRWFLTTELRSGGETASRFRL